MLLGVPIQMQVGCTMVLEQAVLQVKPGEEQDFEAAFARAQRIIAQASGYLSHSLSKSIERPGRYLLLVEWESLEAHTVGFRGSPGYLEWRSLLHHFYDPFPDVEHYEAVYEGSAAKG